MSTASITYSPVERSPLPDESSPELPTRGNIAVEGPSNPDQGRVVVPTTLHSVRQRSATISSATKQTTGSAKPPWKDFLFTKRQLYALLLMLSFGLAPILAIVHSNAIFTPKVQTCGDFFGQPQNSTKSGIESLFVLDFTYGEFPFSQAKLIDVAWDIIIGRGIQLASWYASYVVFSNAVLRVIERHSTSYKTFMHITLEGASLASLWAMTRELFRTKSKRTWALFFYMMISIGYVLCIPIFLSAMTGYDSTTIAWFDLDGDNQIVPASFFKPGLIVYSAGNTTFENGTCSAAKSIYDYEATESARDRNCDCQTPNGTVMPYPEWTAYRIREDKWDEGKCVFNFTGNNDRFQDPIRNYEWLNCNDSLSVTIDNKHYEITSVNSTNGYCYQDHGYSDKFLTSRMRCLPDTANPSYSWGFSTMLSGIFCILQLIWCCTMYVVWQDAQYNSRLVASGYSMTPLRAGFALATAAKWRTGLKTEVLVRRDTEILERELFGSGKKQRKTKGAKVMIGVFEASGGGAVGAGEETGLRKRNKGA